jgi:5-methylcytosine-specific restriction endonuclease McrA
MITTMTTATEHHLEKWRRLLLVRDSRVVYVVPETKKEVRASICVLCGAEVFYRTYQLQAHHIRPKSLFPGIALRLDNGVMLCAGHHQGLVHNHNAGLDVFSKDFDSGWATWVVHFNRWNDLAVNEKFNAANQHRLPIIQPMKSNATHEIPTEAARQLPPQGMG